MPLIPFKIARRFHACSECKSLYTRSGVSAMWWCHALIFSLTPFRPSRICAFPRYGGYTFIVRGSTRLRSPRRQRSLSKTPDSTQKIQLRKSRELWRKRASAQASAMVEFSRRAKHGALQMKHERNVVHKCYSAMGVWHVP